MSEPKKVITLTSPIVFGKTTIEELSFREPVAGDFWGLPIDKQTVGHILELGSLLCAQPPAVLARLSLADLKGVLDVVGGFISAGLGTLTTP